MPRVVIEVRRPDEAQRLHFLCRHLGAMDSVVLKDAAAQTDGLSFAHLQEILRHSGLLALNAGRTQRIAEDIVAALDVVRAAHTEAMTGFREPPEMPFGLAALHQGKTQK